ncbi:hypothetical protein ABII15_30425 [Streptomyces sp. HUAS MG91]|uniref:DUF11 domain-containing protein n=1 Tax=Streptomyces tabacisoli TaxID=3156398 RepID=A0AAU8J0T5_9ACTN
MIIGRAGRVRAAAPRAGRRARVRGAVIALLLGLVCWPAPVPTAADGTGAHGLALAVSVNTRPGTGALRPGIRTGGPVVKTYLLTNRGGADLSTIRVRDPALPGARIRCPGGSDRVPRLTGLRSVRCTATGRARPGTWVGAAVAAGRLPYLRSTVRASARSGYAGVGGALVLVQSARVTGPERARVRYAVTNTGNRPVLGVRITDPGLDPAHREPPPCPVVARIAPGATGVCSTEVRRAPGTYTGRGLARGTDGLGTLGPRGGRVAPPPLTARAAARFTLPGGRGPDTPPPPPSSPAAVPPPGRADQAAPEPPAAFPLPPGAPALPPEALDLPPGAVGVPPGAVPAPVPPAALLARVVPPPPGIAPPGVAQPPPVRPPGRPVARPRQQASPRVPLLRRFVRADHRPTGLGLLTALFLVLLPAALAAILLGSRKH